MFESIDLDETFKYTGKQYYKKELKQILFISCCYKLTIKPVTSVRFLDVTIYITLMKTVQQNCENVFRLKRLQQWKVWNSSPNI